MKQYKVVFGFMKGEGKGIRVRGIFRCYEAPDVADLAKRCLDEIKYWRNDPNTWKCNLLIAELEQIEKASA